MVPFRMVTVQFDPGLPGSRRLGSGCSSGPVLGVPLGGSGPVLGVPLGQSLVGRNHLIAGTPITIGSIYV